MSNWDRGRYERTAEELRPAAEVTVARLALQPGERVLDVACGTGNAALLAAAAGAHATGLDSAPRLVEVARERAAGEQADAEFVVGDATALPFPDGEFDAVVSIFGVIFAQPAEVAARELTRVVRPGGRVLVTAWIPGGPISAAGRVLGEAVAAAGVPSPPRTDWSDPEVAAALFAGHDVTSTEAALAFTAPSPEAVADAFFAEHPMWLTACEVLPPEETERVRGETVALLRDGNEDPAAFRSTSRWRLLSVQVR